MSDSNTQMGDFVANVIKRRSVMKGAALAGAGLATSGLAMRSARAAGSINVVDADVLNFALNLEYLEANYYLLGVTGQALTLTNGGPAPVAPATTLVPFQTPALAYYFQRIAADEQQHVSFLQTALGAAAVAQPQINLTTAFTTLAVAAGLIEAGQTFNPFSSEIAFLVGSYIFEDVGITAYAGGAAYLTPTNLPYAASILAMEGYHTGAIRGYLAAQGGSEVTNAISALRANLSGAADDNGTSINGGNPFNIVNSDINGQCFRRTFNQVLNIVYGSPTPAASGLFFPAGMTGRITDATDTFVPYTSITT